ncbi:MAG TPA: DNA ligase D [Pseudomonas sp.]|jgi:bifunctional non-homologous end joining protein LigD|uniref:DNA ligase D n=1 Tax=Pseudomonas sp. TaxID=306 RepID=UPI002EDB6551
MNRSLDEYQRRRDFEATPEPSGNKIEKGVRSCRKSVAEHALQFCIQKHDATRLHYDFRLEINGTLKSWAVPKGPSLDPTVRRLAVHVEDHPLDYAAFEGHIPEGHYGAGDVIVWDRGVWIPQGDPAAAYEKGRLKFQLEGEKLGGLWNLVRTHLEGKQEQWFLIKSKDSFARAKTEYDIVGDQPDSVLSERTLIAKKRATEKAPAKPPKQIAKKNATAPPAIALAGAQVARLPETIKPELATLVESAPDGDWRYELKFDGYRIMARIDNGKVQLFTRNGHDWSAKMPRQTKALKNLGLESAWLDGEVVVADEDGMPDFQALQNAFESGSHDSIVFYLFDMPYLNGMDLREVVLGQRRAALAAVLERGTDDALRFSEDFSESADNMLNSVCQMKMEGLIGKRVGSLYQSRRSTDWIKLKCKHRQEFVVVGFSEPKGSRSAFGALLLGLHDADSGELCYAGKVGTGFNEATLRSIHARLKPLEVKTAPVVNPPTGFEAKGVHWLKPELLAEVAFAEMTREGSVRHSVFHGLRDDKPATQISEEQAKPAVAVEKPKPRSAKQDTTQSAKTAPSKSKAAEKASGDGKIRITHPERVIDASSGATKMQLAQYYAQVFPWIAPHLQDRPVALVRAPEGIAGELFFQKNADKLAIPGLISLGKEHAGQSIMIIDNPEALIGAVQMSTIELHTWNATSADLDHPDRFILDLDPDPALPWKHMVEATQLTLTILDELGLKSFLKTSGGKGIHIVVPLKPKAGWDEVKAFSQAIVTHMAKLLPERFSAVSGPKNRVGKIFIDYLRNSQGATTICAFSARTRDGLPISVPVLREEVAQLKGANGWNIQNFMERLADQDDPWAGYAKVKQTITADMRKRIGMKR